MAVTLFPEIINHEITKFPEIIPRSQGTLLPSPLPAEGTRGQYQRGPPYKFERNKEEVRLTAVVVAFIVVVGSQIENNLLAEGNRHARQEGSAGRCNAMVGAVES